MARRNAARKREIMPDAILGSEVVTKLINCVMKDGKKSIAEGIVYGALNTVAARGLPESDALQVLKIALNNVIPKVEVKSRRVGGSTYQVPSPVPLERGQAMGFRALIEAALKQREKGGMSIALATQIISAYQNTGPAVKKRDDLYKMAEANKAFAHFRWN